VPLWNCGTVDICKFEDLDGPLGELSKPEELAIKIKE
jgi:hypothetical protein